VAGSSSAGTSARDPERGAERCRKRECVVRARSRDSPLQDDREQGGADRRGDPLDDVDRGRRLAVEWALLPDELE
jgi:hypothetical protein